MSEAVNVKSPVKHFNKLVRDKIPEIIEASGQECRYRTLSKEDFIYALEVKLDEEIAEYRNDHSLEELADIMEVLHALLQARGYSFKDLVYACQKKCDERGGFCNRVYLECVYPKGYSE